MSDTRFFDSIMSSSRQINNLTIDVKRPDHLYQRSDYENFFYEQYGEEILNYRLIEIFGKFRRHLKRLKINLRTYSWDHYVSLMSAACDLEDLNLSFPAERDIAKNVAVPLKKFSKLKRLHLHSHTRVKHLLEAIPDNSLDEFSFDHTKLLDISDIQEFVNRQKKIKKWSLHPLAKISIDELDLEQLTCTYHEDQYSNGLNAVLRKQPELRHLTTFLISDATFDRVCRLRKLERLNIMLDSVEEKSSIGRLNNLLNLVYLELLDHSRYDVEFWPGSSFLGRLKLPKLQKMKLHIKEELDPELFVDLAGGVANLQELEIHSGRVRFLSQAIASLQSLKTFTVIQTIEVGTKVTVPTRTNESIEKLHICMPFCGGKPMYDLINACPNVKQMALREFGRLDAGLLECVRRLAKLTNFYFTDRSPRDFRMNEQLDPSLAGIIEHFLKTPNFAELFIDRIPDFKINLVKELIGNDVEKAVGVGYLRIVKKSRAREVFANFY